MNKNTVRITKEFSFEMSHMLKNHRGECKNIHGHSYRLFVTIVGKPKSTLDSPEDGMLIDFSELKEIVNHAVIEPFDHALVVSEAAYKNSFLENYKGKLIVKPFEPTCENLISDFAKYIILALPQTVELYGLKLYETATSFTEWFMSDNNEL